MRYWVYGIDGVSRKPCEPLFVDAESEDEAKAQAKELGMAVEEVEVVHPKTAPPPVPEESSPPATHAEPERSVIDHPIARVLVVIFRVLAVVVAFLYTVLITMTLQAASQAAEMASKLGRTVEVPAGVAVVRVILEAVVVVSLLLAVAELLRLGMALERNTRSRTGREAGS